jgi:DNA polymerase-3 subunit epsilon
MCGKPAVPNISAIIHELGLSQRDAHDALNDAVMAALAFIKLRQLRDS